MNLNKTLSEWGNKLKKKGFNVFIFADEKEIILLEIPTKNFKASIWKEKGKLLLFIPFPNSVIKEIANHLEDDFSEIAEEKIKKLCSLDDKLTVTFDDIKPKPLYLERDVMGMNASVSNVEDVIDLLKKFDGIYEKAER